MVAGQQRTTTTCTEVSNMNPPINRDNLRDALIAVVIATGLIWVVDGYREIYGQSPRTRTHQSSHPTTNAMGNAHPRRALMSADFTRNS
jgi:hypothetical protein